MTLVFNDGAYGNVKRIQQQRFGADRTIASDLRNPDFVAFAESFGALGLRASGPDEVRPALERAFAHGGPVVIDVAAPADARSVAVVHPPPRPWRSLSPFAGHVTSVTPHHPLTCAAPNKAP